MQLVMNPEQFDVIVTTNLFGDILSDLCAGLVGGLGMAPGANIGKDCAIFEAVHGSAPDIAGKNLANPTSVILAAIQMLEYLGMADKANNIRAAITDVIESGDRTTRDLGGSHGTTDFTNAVLERL
jgi:isocitrate dehydrogenase (NAD+)